MFDRIRAVARRMYELNERVREGISAFIHLEVSGAIVLLLATVAALVLANASTGEWYENLWHIETGFFIGAFEFAQSLLHWIDDGLMALFFFVVGLEIKREFIVGELSTPRKAALPIIAAVGGMLVPAAIYILFNRGTETAAGWGIPMATDIAFALGIMALLGDRVPAALKVFVTALAIADDIGAVLVIALFYTAEVFPFWLLIGAALFVVLILLNRAGVDSPIPYLILAVFVWFCFLNSGVHATVAGILVAFTIPAKARMEAGDFVDWARLKIDEIEMLDRPGAHVLETPDQQVCAMELQSQARWIQAPLQRAETGLHPISTFMVLPLFALANAGVSLGGAFDGGGLSPAMLGVFFGLVLGKPIGIALFTWLATVTRVSSLPEGVTWQQIGGAGALCGVGFTMSLFISGLAFRQGGTQDEVKLAILVSSLIAGIIGYVLLRRCADRRAKQADSDA